MINLLNNILEVLGRPLELLINQINKTGDDVKMAKYILVEDKNLKSMDGVIFKVLEETPKQFVVDYKGTKAWIQKESARIMPDKYDPTPIGAPGTIPLTAALDQITKSVWAPKIEEVATTPIEEQMKRSVAYFDQLDRSQPEAVAAPIGSSFRLGVNVKKTINAAAGKIEEEAKNTTPDGYLEEWPNLDDNVDNHVDDVDNWAEDPRTIAMSKDNDRLRAQNKGLKQRSLRKGHANDQMNKYAGRLEKTIKELNRDQDGLIEDNNKLKAKEAELIDTINEAEKTILHQGERLQTVKAQRDELEKLNKHHQEQVDIGNERRQRMKETVASLHEQLHAKNVAIESLKKINTETMAERDMYKEIIETFTTLILKNK